MIQTIRSDNGKKYTSGRFQQFYDESSIEHQLTELYTLQHNCVSKKKNRSIIEMTRCILYENELPKKLWAEIANTVVYLVNRMSTSVLYKRTPFEAWFGYKPNL
jgi:transposase InsO family protein